VRPVRATRSATRRRRRIWLTVIGLPLVLALIATAIWWLADGGPFGGGSEPDPAVADQTLTVIAYRGEQTGIAVLATSRSGARDPVVLVVPTNIIASVPGHGTGPLAEALAGGASVAQTTVANLLGLPLHQRGMLTPEGMAELGDAAGGIPVDLGARATVLGETVGPGEIRMRGEQVAAYLDGATDPLEVTLRFEEVVTGLLDAARRDPSALQGAAEDPSPGFGVSVAAVPADTLVEELPIKDAGSGVASMDTAKAETLIDQLFARPTDQVASVVLLNGNGVPGIGANLAARIVPAGYRVVVSTNARTFDAERTQIVVRDERFMSVGRRLRSLIGVGQVSVGHGFTGLADITVVIGMDFGGE
jgi:hypothetical protein